MRYDAYTQTNSFVVMKNIFPPAKLVDENRETDSEGGSGGHFLNVKVIAIYKTNIINCLQYLSRTLLLLFCVQ